MNDSRPCSWILLAAMLLAPAARASQPSVQPPRPSGPLPVTIIGRELERTRAILHSIGAGGIVTIDTDGVRRTVPFDRVLALISEYEQIDRRASWPEEVAPGTGWVRFTNAERFHGTIMDSTRPDSIRWRADVAGDLVRPLEEVRSVRFDTSSDEDAPAGSAGAAWSGTSDEVVYANADRAEGFVSALGTTITIERDSRSVSTPATLVQSVRLANPPEPRRGIYLWLTDGTAARTSSVSAADSLLTATLEAGGARVFKTPQTNLAGVLFGAERMTPLSVLDFRTTSGGPGRRWTAPASLGDEGALGIADIDLPGPMSVEWTLPPRAQRVGADLVLPPECRVWGDCVVVVEVQSGSSARTLLSARLNASSPEASFAGDASGAGVLRVRVEAGERGAIQDHVVVRRGMVLTK